MVFSITSVKGNIESAFSTPLTNCCITPSNGKYLNAILSITLGRVDLWWVNLQQYVWFLGKAEPM